MLGEKEAIIVYRKGKIASIHSASHGAGRKMSRAAALNSITHNALKEELAKRGVTLLFGGGLDEAPFAYKNIETIMQSQKLLVGIIVKFTPKNCKNVWRCI